MSGFCLSCDSTYGIPLLLDSPFNNDKNHQSPRAVRTELFLTNDQGVLGGEAVLRDLEVQRGRTLSGTAGDVIMRTVAGAEPAAKVTGLADGDTTKVGADT